MLECHYIHTMENHHDKQEAWSQTSGPDDPNHLWERTSHIASLARIFCNYRTSRETSVVICTWFMCLQILGLASSGHQSEIPNLDRRRKHPNGVALSEFRALSQPSAFASGVETRLNHNFIDYSLQRRSRIGTMMFSLCNLFFFLIRWMQHYCTIFAWMKVHCRSSVQFVSAVRSRSSAYAFIFSKVRLQAADLSVKVRLKY